MSAPILLRNVAAGLMLLVFCLRGAMEVGRQLGGGMAVPPGRYAPPPPPDWLVSAITEMHPSCSVSVDSATKPFEVGGEEWLSASYRTFRGGEWRPEYRCFRRSNGSVASWPISED